MDFQNLIREDYREQIVQEFRANANIHKDFYEQTFPICLKNGEVWLHTRLALREKGTGTNGGDKSFGVIQRVEAPKEVEQKNTLRRVNDLLRRQNYISQSLLRFLHDDDVDSLSLIHISYGNRMNTAPKRYGRSPSNSLPTCSSRALSIRTSSTLSAGCWIKLRKDFVSRCPPYLRYIRCWIRLLPRNKGSMR